MRRVLWLPALAVALCALGTAVADEPGEDSEIFIQIVDDEPDGGLDGGALAGAVVDGGEVDADAGPLEMVDGGVDAGERRDAGRPFVDRWFWMSDGGTYPSGATDRVEVRVGHWVDVHLYKPAVMTVCDAPIVSVKGEGDAVRFTALDAGSTRCGFWLGQAQPFPDRLVDVEVVPRTP